MSRTREAGYTLVELLVTITLIGILSTTLFIIFRSTIFDYLGLQKQASSFSQLNSQSDRVSNVLRGATSVVEADKEELIVLAYFYPSDEYVSQVRYYTQKVDGQQRLLADLVPMTANPPLGALDLSKKKTVTIIENLYKAPGVNLFEYLNAESVVLSAPVNDVSIIKSIRINLSVEVDKGRTQTLNMQVLLRNKKNNL